MTKTKSRKSSGISAWWKKSKGIEQN